MCMLISAVALQIFRKQSCPSNVINRDYAISPAKSLLIYWKKSNAILETYHSKWDIFKAVCEDLAVHPPPVIKEAMQLNPCYDPLKSYPFIWNIMKSIISD